MPRESIDDVFLSRLITSLESARANAGDAFTAKDLNSLKGEIKEAETYFSTALDTLEKDDCEGAFEYCEKGLRSCRNAFKADNMNDAKGSANKAMELAIKAIEATNACYEN
jgi:hypothetical protein